jgi:hypothetical protein
MEKKPQEETEQLLNCDVCLKEIPAESGEYFETDAYVRHFCGIDCYRKWQQEKKSGEN